MNTRKHTKAVQEKQEGKTDNKNNKIFTLKLMKAKSDLKL